MPLPRSLLGQRTADRDTRQLRVRLDLQTVAGGGVTDHGSLLGLGDDDHSQYVHLSAARTITGQHSFTPASPQAPFLLGTNAQSQLVTGFRADQLNKSISSSGLGLTGGGTLTASQTITLASSSDPGATAAILASDASGFLQLERLSLGSMISPTIPLHVRFNTEQARIEYDVSNYFTVSVDLNANATLSSVGSQASLILQPAGDIIIDPTGNDVLPLTTYDINLGAINKKYLTIHAAELWVQTLVAQEVLATIGGRVLVGPTTILEQDLTGTNMIVNGDFENRTGNDFDNWTETVGSGAIVAETGDPYTGSSAIKLTRGATDNTNAKSDNIAVTAGDLIFCELWYKTDGVAGGRWLIWDQTHSTIILVQQVTGTETAWTYDHLTFEIPAACTQIYWELRPPGTVNAIAYFDRLAMWPGNIYVKHNQMDDNDTVIMEKNGFLEFVRVNEFGIVTADTTGNWFETNAVFGDIRKQFPSGKYFAIRGSTGNDGTYQSDEVSPPIFTGGKTRIFIEATVPSSVGDGYIAWTSDSLTGPYAYPRIQRDLDHTGMNPWDIGDAVFNTGVTGDGFIDLYSVSGLISGAGPTITGNVRQSSTFNDIEERWAIGNLNGLYGYAADEYGAAFGDPAGDRITIEPTGGVKIIGASGNVNLGANGLKITADTTGYLESRAINWFDGGSETFRMYSYNAPTTVAFEAETRIVAGKDSLVEFDVRAASTKKATFNVNLFADGGADTGSIGFSLTSAAVGTFQIGQDNSLFAMRLNSSDNSLNTAGLTIDIDAQNDEVFSVKMDIAHGLTNLTQTDTIFAIRKWDSNFGGIQFRALSTSNVTAWGIKAVSKVTEATTSTTGRGAILLDGLTDTGTTWTSMAATENVLVMRNGSITRWIMKGDGEIHSDFHSGGATGHANYDDYNDIELLRSFDLKSSAMEIADTWFNKNLQTLQELGIIHDIRPDGMFVSQQKMTKLQIGAIWQLYNKIEDLERRLELVT